MGTAAALATLEVVENESLIENTEAMGKLMAAEMATMPHVQAVRQHGALIGADIDPRFPVGKVIKMAAEEHDMILHSCGKNALRIIPAYIIKQPEIEIFHDKLHKILSSLEKDAERDTSSSQSYAFTM
jgi:acetylornithine/succinyldiaminopimelate/putrescine aminotransferase